MGLRLTSTGNTVPFLRSPRCLGCDAGMGRNTADCKYRLRSRTCLVRIFNGTSTSDAWPVRSWSVHPNRSSTRRFTFRMIPSRLTITKASCE